MKKKSLARQFSIIFVLFAVLTVALCSILTFTDQSSAYRKDVIKNMNQVTAHLAHQMSNGGLEFKNLKEYYDSHKDVVQIPVDFRGDLPKSEKAFNEYMTANYSGRIVGLNINFDELDSEAQRLYVIWRFEYWFTMFFDAVDDFELSYIYFIYPELSRDRVMIYMFDPTMTVITTDDGREILELGFDVYEDPAMHKYMWEAWDSGKAPDGVDSLDNEFGYVYTYCHPVYSNGEKVGLVCAEISVERVQSTILHSTLRLVLVTVILFAASMTALFFFLKKNVLNRLEKLEKNVIEYSEKKDPALSVSIMENSGTEDEIGSLSTRFAGMITELDVYMNDLRTVTAEKERIGAELNVATKIQADMLPRIFPAFPNHKDVDIFATMDPAKEVGGDFYDFFLVDDCHLALVIADVSGKGVPAALFMVIAKTLIKSRVQMGEEPGAALINVNEQLLEGNEAELFVTVWLAVIDLRTGDGIAANAGHEYPALRRGKGDYELIRTKHSPAVATMEGIRFRQHEFHVDPGDSIFVYTDGVTEATNSNLELFGEERLLNALNRNKDLPLKELLPAVRNEIDDFVGTAPQFDDITMLGFTFIKTYEGKSDGSNIF